MVIRSLFNSKQKVRNVLLRVSIRQHDVIEVKRLLTEGADPNSYADASDRYLPLANAIRHSAPLEIFDALLKSGGDPQEPYRFLGREFMLSEAAEMSNLAPEIVDRLKEAELEAEAKNGSRDIFRGSTRKSCWSLKFGT